MHWIKADTLERESAALSCRHFSSPHTYNRIAELLEEIHTEYRLTTDTIVAPVTDNASNFAKAFEEFNSTVLSEEQDETEEQEQELSYITMHPEREDMSVCHQLC